jgi:hypothetical protein
MPHIGLCAECSVDFSQYQVNSIKELDCSDHFLLLQSYWDLILIVNVLFYN